MKIQQTFPRVNGEVFHSTLEPDSPSKSLTFDPKQYSKITDSNSTGPAQYHRPSPDVIDPPDTFNFFEEVIDWLTWPVEFQLGENEFYVDRWRLIAGGVGLIGVAFLLFNY